MAERVVEVEIIKAKSECAGGCGLDWSSPETAALAQGRIRERFGGKVRLLVVEGAEPALLINGQPRIRGEFDIRALLDVIEAELEIIRGGEADG